MKSYTLKIRGGAEVDNYGKKAGKGALIQEEKSATLGVSQDQILFQAIRSDVDDKTDVVICDAYGETGIGYWQKGIQTLRAEGENRPSRPSNVVICIEGNGARPSHRGIASRDGGGEPRQGYPCVVTFEPGIASRDGGHVYENVSGTIRATPGDNQMTVAYDIGEARLRTPQEYIEKSPTLTARCGTGGNNVPAVVFENHAQDSRYKGPLEVAQPVTALYGTGGNNQPLVVFSKIKRAKTTDDFETWGETGVCNTLNTFDNGDVRTNECIICMATQQGGAEILEDKSPTITAAAGMSGNNQPVICLQGNGIDRADTAGCNGRGWTENVSYTLIHLSCARCHASFSPST